MSTTYNEQVEDKVVDSDCQCNNVNPADPTTIPKFVDPLVKPPVAKPDCQKDNVSYYEIDMRKAVHKFHRDFPCTTIWGYWGMCPGPTIETMRDKTVEVKWINCLPKKHFLPVDKTLHGVTDTPEVRTVVHLHGANVEPESDGHPEAWFTQNYAETGSHFKKEVYKYTNHQQAATLWYHDHTLGMTRLNVYAGLAGFYLIRDTLEPRLKLPAGDYEIPLMIQDKSFKEDGSLLYPSEPPTPVPGVFPSIAPFFIGNTIVVNGKVWPYLDVEPRKYRFRIVNASNTRQYTLELSNKRIMTLIGTDGGLLDHKREITSVTIAPAERVDLVIDFSQFEGQEIILKNTAAGDQTSDVMKFNVILPLKDEDKSEVPDSLFHFHHYEEYLASKVRRLTLDDGVDHYGRPMRLLNNRMYDDPVTEMPELDTIEIWEIVNLTQIPVPHPIHVHLVQFQILDKRPFDIQKYRSTGHIVYSGNPIPLEASDTGWKDTVRVNPGQVTRIIAKFGDFTGDFIWHCHLLEHEDHDMMRPMKVITKYNS